MSKNSFESVPIPLSILSNGFLLLWCVFAAFPITWIAVMSIKIPRDAFASNPWTVITGPATQLVHGGLSALDIIVMLLILIVTIVLFKRGFHGLVRSLQIRMPTLLAWLLAIAVSILSVLLFYIAAVPALLGALENVSGWIGEPLIGFTSEHYSAVWFDRGFFNNFQNSLLVTAGVVLLSMTVGTLAGYGLSRSDSDLAFWLLVIALIFRALPHSVLVAGYMPIFLGSAELLRPIMGDAAPTLYGKPWAVIAVLVAINQPFTIWMLHSFFKNIPKELDEAARIDGCSHFKAFRLVIIPVMWPGVITTALFAFLLAYNDFLVTSLLLDGQNMTMVPAIAGMFNRETTASDEVQAIAAAVSITAPLLILVLVFQRQIVGGLTAGAVKG